MAYVENKQDRIINTYIVVQMMIHSNYSNKLRLSANGASTFSQCSSVK